MFALTNMVHFFASELPRLGRSGLALPFIPSRSS